MPISADTYKELVRLLMHECIFVAKPFTEYIHGPAVLGATALTSRAPKAGAGSRAEPAPAFGALR
ncbi:hypothetical protein [Streptomyces sp. NPDC006527]|uniref:hypothetical protein n=1 Tax=Streptomyces sp. NPDC006527 TaxID=3364749 RepID=UPI0036A2AD98